MAKLEVTLDSDLEKKLNELSGPKMDAVCEKAVKEAGEFVLARMKDRLESVVSDNSTGELLGTLNTSDVMRTPGGDYVVSVGVDPEKYVRKKVIGENPSDIAKSNYVIALVLENGTEKQPARPFAKCSNAEAKTAKEMMEQIIEEAVSGA